MGRRKIKNPVSDESSSKSSIYETIVNVAEMSSDIPQLDLHGRDVPDAEYEIGLFLDRQFMIGETVVKIIHGVGKGILAREVSKIVKDNPHVLYSKTATSGGEGGAVIYVVINK